MLILMMTATMIMNHDMLILMMTATMIMNHDMLILIIMMTTTMMMIEVLYYTIYILLAISMLSLASRVGIILKV